MISRDPLVSNISSIKNNVLDTQAAVSLIQSDASSLTTRVSNIEAQQTRSITGSTDIPTFSDAGKLVLINTSSGSVFITINSSLSLATGKRIDFVWLGAAAAVTFQFSGVALNATPGLKLRNRYSAATVLCVGSGNYVLIGDINA